MSLTAAAMQMLADKGLCMADIIAVAAANEPAQPAAPETAEERRRRLDRERKRALRSAENADKCGQTADTARPQMSAENAEMSADLADKCGHLHARREDITLNSVDHRLAAAVVEAREPVSDWPDDPIKALVAAVASPNLDPAKSPGLITTSGRLAAWRRDGASWTHDVLPVVLGLCAKAKKPIAYWKYFDDAVAQAIADNRRALQIPEASLERPDPRNDRPTDARRAATDSRRDAWAPAIAKRAGLSPGPEAGGASGPDRDGPSRLRLAHAG